MHYKEIERQEDLILCLKANTEIKNTAFQNMNFEGIAIKGKSFEDCLFLGGTLPKIKGLEKNNFIFPALDVPFSVYPNKIYTPQTLLNNYKIGEPTSYEKSLDKVIYNHYMQYGKTATSIKETLARRLHDHGMTDALHDFLEDYAEDKCVAVMGGHGLLRDDPSYKQIVEISKNLTEKGYLMLSGGGPGAMEATHLGAYLAGKDNKYIPVALDILKEAPHYKDTFWLDCAFRVVDIIPQGSFESLGIPTWLYGHEPPSPFASKMAKYFANSVREEGLLAIAKGGVIFAPGSAGTIQEIFQDATQNHYLSYGYASPMVFLNKDYWINSKPVYPLLSSMYKEDKYKNLILSIYDDVESIIDEINKFDKPLLV